MKRSLLIALVLTMVLGLGGCRPADEQVRTPQAAPVPQLPSAGENPVPVPEVPEEEEYAWVTERFGPVPDAARTAELCEKLESGQMVVGFCARDCSDGAVLALAENFMVGFEKLGAINGGIFNALGDTQLQRQQIENCVTYEMDLICVVSPDLRSLANVCEEAMEAGTKVVLSALADTANCGFVPSGMEEFPWQECGRRMADMILHYFDTYFPRKREIQVALGKRADMEDLFRGLEEALTADERVAILYEQDGCLTMQDGYDVAEFALELHEDIRVFVCADEAPAIGFNNYVMGHPELDPSEFIVLSAAGSDETAELWTLSEEDLSVYRGYCGIDRKDSAAGLNNCAYACLLELTELPCVYTTVPVYEEAFGYAAAQMSEAEE